MINLEFQDSNKTQLVEAHIGSTYPGIESTPYLFRLVNTGDEPAVVKVYADESNYQSGTSTETYQSTWFSVNNFNYKQNIYVNLPAGDFVEIYMKWRPIDVSRTGDKRWSVKWHVEEANVESICDPST